MYLVQGIKNFFEKFPLNTVIIFEAYILEMYFSVINDSSIFVTKFLCILLRKKVDDTLKLHFLFSQILLHAILI